MRIGRRSVALTNQDRVYFPEAGLTKGDVVQYYLRVADFMLPYLKDRPLSMQRFPEGIDAAGFYHKEAPSHFPEWIDRVRLKTQDGEQDQIVCNSRATLVYLANYGVLTPHAWLSRAPRIEYPDRLIFDLDPPEDDFGAVIFAAGVVREALAKRRLTPFVMTTGSKGLHVTVPIKPQMHFDDVKKWARALAVDLTRRHPDRLTTEIRKDKRKGRLFLDTLRNAYAQTAVAPYAIRARPAATVATPITWEELDAGARPDDFHVRNLAGRLETTGDPWRGMDRHKASLR